MVAINNDWGGGYCANVTLNNAGSTTVSNWVATFSIEGTISSLWNGGYTQQSGATVTLNGIGWNSSAPPGASNPSIGFCANR